MKRNKTLDTLVSTYATQIVSTIKDNDFTKEVDIFYTDEKSIDKKEAAHSAVIMSGIGMVVVFPDFKHNAAMATKVNIGAYKRLVQEGFDDSFVEENGEIYSQLFPFTTDNVDSLCNYLTQRVSDEKTTNETNK